MRLAWVAFLGFVIVGAAAVCSPRLMFPDERDGLADVQVRMAKAEARHWIQIPPLFWLQLSEVRSFSPPETLALPDATLKWRTIFGITYGVTTIGEEGSHNEWDYRPGMAVWAVFLAVEAGLLGFGGWRLWNDC